MAINPDSIPSTESLQETLLDRIYYPYQKQIWAAGVLLVLVILGFLGGREWMAQRQDAMWSRYYRAEQLPAADANAAAEKVQTLRALIEEFPDEPVAAHAQREIVYTYKQSKQWTQAKDALTELRTSYPNYGLFSVKAGDAQSIGDMLEESIEKEISWEAESQYVPHEPKTDRLALVETNVGNFWIAFYDEHAPAHVEAFVQRAKSGGFNRTQVYEVRTDTEGKAQLFLAGSEASKDWADPTEHDRDEPTATIRPEAARFKIRHTQRIVSAVKMPSGESSHAFMVITAKDGHRRYDGDTTPFGAVVDREGSLATLEKIGQTTTYGQHPATKDLPGILAVRQHPYPYIYIRRVSIWKDEKLESGHTWDNDGARIATATPEAWEEKLPEAWKPAAKPAPDTKDDDKDDGAGEDEGEKDDGEAPGKDGGEDTSDGDAPTDE